MKDINTKLNNKIKREVTINDAIVSVKNKAKARSFKVRRKIEDLEELARIENEFILG